MQQIDVLKRPIMTEKSMREAGVGSFTFEVDKAATKGEIRQAIEEQFKVKVVGVQTLVVKGKRSRAGRRRQEIIGSPWKKAIIKLVSGQKIDIFEGVESGKKA